MAADRIYGLRVANLHAVAWAPAGERLAASTSGSVIVRGQDGRFGAPEEAGESVAVLRWSPAGTMPALLLIARTRRHP